MGAGDPRLRMARGLIREGRYLEAEPILRWLHEEEPRNPARRWECATLLTGTVREDGDRLVYVPGLGSRREYAMRGYKLWQKVIRDVEGSTSRADIDRYLEARFHQNMARWAQGAPEKALLSIQLLRGNPGGGGRRRAPTGKWERRFNWLEEQIRAHPAAPVTPPPPDLEETRRAK
jgi:hypothetical protein